MSLVSFRLRRTDDSGSLVRQVDRLDSAIRSDSYVVPSDVNVFSTFSATVIDIEEKTIIDATRPLGQYVVYEYDVLTNWTLTEPLVSEPATTSPIEIHLVVNQYGEPLTVEDGTTLFTCNSTNFVNTFRHVSSLYKPGTWLYYGFFIKYSNGSSEWFERVTSLSVQLPKYYQSVEDLWKRIPEYYRGLDYGAGNGHLRKYLSLFGWELDKTRHNASRE